MIHEIYIYIYKKNLAPLTRYDIFLSKLPNKNFEKKSATE